MPQASIAIAVSGSIGRKIPTRSPLATPKCLQSVAGAIHGLVELEVGEIGPRAVIAFPLQGNVAGTLRQMTLQGTGDVVHAPAAEPARPLDAVSAVEHLPIWLGPHDPQVVADRAPEPGWISSGALDQRVVGVDPMLAGKGEHAAAFQRFGAGLPGDWLGSEIGV